MATTYKVLGQINPTANTSTVLYTVPGTVSALVSTVMICNQSNTSTTFSLAIQPAGAGITTKHYLSYNTTLAAYDTIPLTLGLSLGPTDVISASASSSAISFSAFGAELTLASGEGPVITNVYMTDNTYTVNSATAVALTGGYIKLIGTGFMSGGAVYVDATTATSSLVVNGTEIWSQVPAATAGTHMLSMFNNNSSGSRYPLGLVYSPVPVWTTATYSSALIANVQLLATGDVPLTYSLLPGSILPFGLSLSSSGLITGTASSGVYQFYAVASDLQNQTATQLIILNVALLSSIETLVVAGGGTGGIVTSNRGTGGGAGGLIYITSFPVTGGYYAVTVGAGGASSNGTVAANGVNSSFSGVGRTLTAIGGGSGGYGDSTNNGGIGGSGGGQWYPGYTGAASNQPVNTSDGISTYSTTGWGNKGGDSSSTQPYGSGGGGAGGAGGNWNGANGPVGGLGRSYDISGTTSTYAGGGSSAGYPPAGGTFVFDNTNYGGLGGGGTGYNNAYNTLANGAANKGGGGGSGGSGGSGVVILRYPDIYPLAAATTGTVSIVTTSGYRIYAFQSSGSIIFYYSAPSAPTIGTAYNGGNGTSVKVPFTAPNNNGGSTITSYIATSSPGGITGTLSQAGSGEILVSGLTTGVEYTFTVQAVSAYGAGSPSAASNGVTTAVVFAPTSIEYFMVAGGGSGASAPNLGCGGGGAGGVVTNSAYPVSSTVRYLVTVGAGGAGVNSGGGNNGFNSVISTATGALITAIGGGTGGFYSPYTNATAGGSGGGASWNGSNLTSYGAGLQPGSASGGLGNRGGEGGGGNSGGGGGGAGAVGGNASGNAGGNGGVGTITTLLTSVQATTYAVGQVVSTSVYFAGGGGGGGVHGATAGIGGTGGAGSSTTGGTGLPGTAFTGGGGGGAAYNGGAAFFGGNGGSGAVIVRHSSTLSQAITTGTVSVFVSAGYVNYIFTSSGSLIW